MSGCYPTLALKTCRPRVFAAFARKRGDTSRSCSPVRPLTQVTFMLDMRHALITRRSAHSLGVSWSVLSNRVPMSSVCLQAAPTEDYPKQVTKTTPTHPDVHTDRPTHSYTLRHTPELPPAHRRQLRCVTRCGTKTLPFSSRYDKIQNVAVFPLRGYRGSRFLSRGWPSRGSTVESTPVNDKSARGRRRAHRENVRRRRQVRPVGEE